jgi:hypothetical protein
MNKSKIFREINQFWLSKIFLIKKIVYQDIEIGKYISICEK